MGDAPSYPVYSLQFVVYPPLTHEYGLRMPLIFKVRHAEEMELAFEEQDWKVSLYGVTVRKEMYLPGHIQAELLIGTEKPLTVDYLKQFFLNASVTLSVASSTVATGYYVHEITPQFENVTGSQFIFVKLDIFSPDKRMTRNAFSRAYLGQRLIGDIVEEMKGEFGVTTETRMLQRLGYSVTENGKTVTKELIHPYLVQYNESFHDFLSRVANRCGEAFYFENGALCFGLSDKTTSIENARRVVYQRIAGDSVTVSDYARDTVKEKRIKNGNVNYDLEDDAILTDPVGMGDKGYPADAFPAPPSEGAFPHFRNSEIASEDHYLLLYKDKFARDDLTSMWWGDTGQHLISMLGDVLNSTSLLDLLSSWIVSMTMAAISAGATYGEATAKGNKLLSKQALQEGMDYAVMYAKVDKDPAHWVSLDYYHDIRVREEAQMRKLVRVDMGVNVADVHLGGKITLPNDDATYVVCRVDMAAGVAWQRDYEDLSQVDYHLRGTSPAPSQVIYAIPLYAEGSGNKLKYVFYPPLLAGKSFRRSGPQPAFIVDSSDPTKQGRVRVRFAWQPSLKVEDDKVDSCKTAYDKAVTDADPLKDDLEKYSKSGSVKVKDGVVTAKKLPDADQEKYDEALITFQEKVTAYYEKKTPATEKAMIEARDQLENYADPASILIQDGVVEATISDGADSKQFNDALDKYQKAVDNIYQTKDDWEKAEVKRTIKEAASPWIRMTTPMATTGGGMYFKPEKGDEVMVDFENGNVERPFVVGNLYSKNAPAPREGSRVIVSKNGHTIKMSDPTDGTLFLAGALPGFKLMSSFGLEIDGLDGNMNEALGGIEMTDKYGIYKIKMSSHDRRITISSPIGDVKMSAFTGISINAPNGDIKITGKNVDITAYNKLSVTSGKNIKASEGYGGYFKDILNPVAVGEAVAKKMIDATVGQFFDLSLLRSLLEVVIRPVDGTLKIKSHRFMLLEAGKGEAHIPMANYKARVGARMMRSHEAQMFVYVVDSVCKLVDGYTAEYIKLFNKMRTDLFAIPDSSIPLNYSSAGPRPLVNNPVNKQDLLKKLFSYPVFSEKETGRVAKAIDSAGIWSDISFTVPAPAPAAGGGAGAGAAGGGAGGGGAAAGAGGGAPAAAAPAAGRPAPPPDAQRKAEQVKVVKQIWTLLISVQALKKHVSKYNSIFAGLDKATTSKAKRFKTSISRITKFSSYESKLKSILLMDDPFPQPGNDPNLYKCIRDAQQINNSNSVDVATFLGNADLQMTQFDNWKKYVKRRMVFSLIEEARRDKDGMFKTFQVKDAAYQAGVVVSNTPFEDAEWGNYKGGVELEEKQSEDESWGAVVWSKVKSGAQALGGMLVDSITSGLTVFERNAWGPEAKGNILFSDNGDKTSYFDNNGGIQGADNAEYGEGVAGATAALRNIINI